MRILRLALPAGIALAAIAVSGFLLFGHNGSSNTGTGGLQPPPVATGSSGNANIAARAKKTGDTYRRDVIVRPRDRRTGAPVRGAEVSMSAVMTSPHIMPLSERGLREISRGTYEGRYTFIMKGDWTLTIIVRSKKLGASTSKLPVKVGR